MSAEVRVDFFDTTLRDGAQSLPEVHQFPVGSKYEVAQAISELGVSVIEAGFPRTPGDSEEVQAVVEAVGTSWKFVETWQNGQPTGSVGMTPVIAGLCRTTPEDIVAAWDAVKAADYPRIHTFVSSDPEHMAAKFPGKTEQEVLEMGRSAVALAREVSQGNPDATVEFSAEAASTTDTKYLEQIVCSAINAGADIVNLPDTVGQRNPFWMKKFYEQALNWIMRENPSVVLSAHNHNDRAMATANSLALVFAAMDFAQCYDRPVSIQIEATVCGLGERAGNTDIFPVVASIFKDTEGSDVPVRWQFNPGKSVSMADVVMRYAGLEVDRQNPIVGKDTIVHRSGIHSDGVIKGGYQIYTPHSPTFWGHDDEARHENGKYQGKAGKLASAEHR